MRTSRTLFAAFAVSLLVAGCRHREPAGSAGIAAPGAPVIIISIDTLRADHLPAYGYRGVETPNLDALRKDSALFRHAYAHVPLTLPSHVTMLTGLLPPDNGVRNNIGFPFDASKHPTIPSLLKQKGYTTGGAVSAYVLRGNTGLAQSFDFYDDDIAVKPGEVVGRLQRPGGETAATAERWIDQHASQPFFFFLHLFEPHTPYDPPEPFKSRYAANLYDGEIAAADAIVGGFLDHLKARGLYDGAVIVLMSDHGEGLGDHGEDEHGIFLYMEDIHVPLMLKLPKRQLAGQTVDAPVQLTDILPTITKLAGIETPAGVTGRSLVATAVDQKAPARRIYGESMYARIHLGWSELRSLVDDRFHFIVAPRPELYSLDEPAETKNVLADERRIYAGMKSDIDKYRSALPSPSKIDPEEAKKLAALGYLSSSSTEASGPLPDPKDRIGDITAMKDAARLAASGKPEEAVARYREVIAKNPRLTDAWTLLAQLLEKMGRYQEAADTYKRGIQVAPSIAGEFSLSLANLYLMLDKPDEAAANAEIGLKTNPGNAHILLGRAALAKGRLPDAAREANEAMSSFNYRPAAMVLLAQVEVKQGRLTEAASLIDQAQAEIKEKKLEVPPLLFFARGDILARMNQMPAAIAAFDEEITRFPSDRQAYANLAVIYLLAGQRAEAHQTMQRLVAANPDRSSYAIAVKTFDELHATQLAAEWRRRAAQIR
ncbi:MAG TPA: sulfatase-like hydrolase/transferase [Thermoanaerobaculia bacterium]|nr:sulfatase-like hydrolase/transferase [Thermoanaerobaculia bacterium]